MAVDPNGSNLDVNRCPTAFGYGSGLAVLSTGGAATLTAVETCRKMYIQALISNVDYATVAFGSAASSQSLVVPEPPTYSLVSAAGVPNCWLEIPCPSTTVPTFWGGTDDDSVRVQWYR